MKVERQQKRIDRKTNETKIKENQLKIKSLHEQGDWNRKVLQ